MSGTMISTPSSSSSGNMMPASTTMIEPSQRKAIMCIPNSPSPPRGITSSVLSVFISVHDSIIQTVKVFHREILGTRVARDATSLDARHQDFAGLVGKQWHEIVDE